MSGERGARTIPLPAARPRSAAPLRAGPRAAGAPLAARPRSPTSLPSVPPGSRPCGLPGPAALSPPPPFVSKAREQAPKEREGGESICFRFVRLREVDRRSGVQTLPANAAGAASRVAGAACPGRAAGPGSARSPPPARSPPLPSVPGSPRARRPAPRLSAPLRSAPPRTRTGAAAQGGMRRAPPGARLPRSRRRRRRAAEGRVKPEPPRSIREGSKWS